MGFRQLDYIRNYGILHDVDGDRDSIPSFSRRNLIYGWNYSGKTTLSRIFRSFSLARHHEDFHDAAFNFTLDDGSKWGSKNLEANHFPVYVFNSEYVDQNLQWGGLLDPILIIGEENIELEKRADAIQAQIEKRRRYDRRLRDRIEEDRKHLEEAASDVARSVRQELGRTPFTRDPHLQPYVDEVRSNVDSHLLSDSEYQTLQSRINAERKNDLQPHKKFMDLSDIWETATTVFRTTAHREVIERLKEQPSTERWIETGLKIHEDKEVCEFCRNPLDPEWLSALNRHFSDEIKRLKTACDDLIRECKAREIVCNPVDSARLYQDLRTAYEEQTGRIDIVQPQINAALQRLAEEAEEKKNNPEESYECASQAPLRDVETLNDAIDEINKVFEIQNNRNQRFSEQRKEAEEALIRHKAAEYVRGSSYDEVLERRADFNGRRASNETALERLRDRAEEIHRQISNARRGAEGINRNLKLYFGKGDIQVELRRDDKYELLRNGHRAKNLSEGEKTAIAFSYFLTRVMDGTEDLNRMVVVIDDPVSSLDSNHIFNTFAMIKTLLKDVGQVFLLTHNHELFRLAKTDAFFKEWVRETPRSSWYLIRRTGAEKSEIIDLPDTLRRYSSEYHYIYALLNRFLSRPDEYEEVNFNVPNLLRKFLETYTSLRMPGSRQALNDRLTWLFEDEVTALRVYRFVNHLSHADSIDASVEFPAKEECVEVVGQAMDELERIDEAHFDSLRALLPG